MHRNDDKGFAKKESKEFFFSLGEREGDKITFSREIFPTQSV